MQGQKATATSALVRRFRNFAALTQEEETQLNALCVGPRRTIAARRDVIREGDQPRGVTLITKGWACRYKTLEDGRRQTLAFLVPGDLCDVNNHLLRAMDHSVAAVSAIEVMEIGHDRIRQLAEHPRLEQVLWWQQLAATAIQREWTLNLGQRSAFERLAHLFCEMYCRLHSVGLADATGYELPITQVDLAEATGLTAVHVNRTLQEMRGDGLIVLKGRRLDIPDFAALQRAGLFNPAYLHLRGAAPRQEAHAAQGRVEA